MRFQKLPTISSRRSSASTLYQKYSPTFLYNHSRIKTSSYAEWKVPRCLCCPVCPHCPANKYMYVPWKIVVFSCKKPKICAMGWQLPALQLSKKNSPRTMPTGPLYMYQCRNAGVCIHCISMCNNMYTSMMIVQHLNVEESRSNPHVPWHCRIPSRGKPLPYKNRDHV